MPSAFLLRPFNDLQDTPGFLLGKRPRLHDADAITDFAGVGLIVRFEPFRDTLHAAIQGMALAPLDRHHDRLLHLVADDQALAYLARRASLGFVMRRFFHRRSS